MCATEADAQALATNSLNPSFVAFLGIPSSYSANYGQSELSSALSGAKISLTVGPTTLTAGTSTALTATTGSNGQATFTYTPTSAGTETITAKLALVSSVVSSAVALNVTAKTSANSSNTTLYAVVAVVTVIIVVAAVLALTRRGGKKGPQQRQN